MQIEEDWLWENSKLSPFDETSDRLGLAKAFSRCFGDVDGEVALNHLRALTLDRALGAQADNDALRHLEGQRQLVLYIISLIDRGKTPL